MSVTDRREPAVVGPGRRLGPDPALAPDHRPVTRICETYGLAKEAASPPRLYRRPRLSPALAIAAGTGEVLMSRLREGRATPPVARTSCVNGGAGALRRCQGTTHGAGRQRLLSTLSLKACQWMSDHPPARQPADLIEAIPEGSWIPFPTAWTAPPMSPRIHPVPDQLDACAGAAIVRRVKPRPASSRLPDTAIPSSPRMGRRLELEADHRPTPRSSADTRPSSTATGCVCRRQRFAAAPGWRSR